ncbi:MAG: heme exporter protein B [Cognaticolwellia sp.]|jgi:heme exporter protein B
MADRTQSERSTPSWLVQTWQIMVKDLVLGWRTRAKVVAMVVFAGTMLLLFSFAIGPNNTLLAKHAAGYVWLSALLSSTLLLSQSFQIEGESGALEGLLLLPVDPRAIFYGKALANWIVLSLLTGLVLVGGFFLFSVEVDANPLRFVGILLLGSAGISAPGTLYSALTARAEAQQLMLPVLLFPLVIPCMLAAVKATTFLIQGDPMDQGGSWTMLLICFNLIYWALGGVLFGKVVDE